MQLFFVNHALVETSPLSISQAAPRGRRVPDSCPIIVDALFWPMQPWTEFLRQYSQNISVNSARAYGRDLFSFAEYLAKRGLNYLEVDNQVLVSYRDERLANGLSQRSWQRETVVLRAFFKYLKDSGEITSMPWHQVGRYSVLNPRPHDFDLRVRTLTRNQWNSFRNVGLGGDLPSGEIDASYRGKFPMRDMVGAEIALTTGMRLQEWRTLMTVELATLPSSGGAITLEATAKGSKRRTVYIPESTMSDIELYIQTERQRLIRQAQKSLRNNIENLAIIEKHDTSSGTLHYRYQGEYFRKRTYQIPITHRAVMTEVQDSILSPVSLFLGSTGKPTSQRAWQSTFLKANRRVWKHLDIPKSQQIPVTPHDLRHTFAVVLLRNLQRRAYQIQGQGKFGLGGISEQIVSNPLLTVQRLLGHSSPATTMNYLRYLEDSDLLVQRAFEEWNNPEEDYADFIIPLLFRDEEKDG